MWLSPAVLRRRWRRAECEHAEQNRSDEELAHSVSPVESIGNAIRIPPNGLTALGSDGWRRLRLATAQDLDLRPRAVAHREIRERDEELILLIEPGRQLRPMCRRDRFHRHVVALCNCL